MRSRKSSFDVSEVIEILKKSRLTKSDMLSIEKPMALHIVNEQKRVVPRKTRATMLSIKQHIFSASARLVVDHIGPSTDYAPYIEYGVASKPNYPIQPFVRPSIKNESRIALIGGLAFGEVLRKKIGRT